VEKPKKKKLKEKSAPEQHIPGQYVMLKAPEDDPVDVLLDPGNVEAINGWNQIGVVSENVLRALLEKKFFSPTEIQRVSIPASVYGKSDILGAAETGSGKTLAFGLPIIQNIEKMLEVNDESGRLYCLILTPTRELAQQIHQHLTAVAKYTKVTIACIIGGLATVKQERVLKKNPQIVIGTPGRIWELIQDGNEHLNKMNDLKFLCIDETDRMIEKGHFAELENILQLVNSNEGSKKRQTFVFSATLTMVHELPDYLMKKKKQKPANMTREQRLQVLIDMFGMKNQKVFDITNDSGVAEKVIESRILCTIDEKDFYLYYILSNYPGRTIVFCNSIDCVKRTASVLTHLNISPIVLHGNMEQKQRLKNLEK
jgi:ATP-dependent RNA helicase DDX24/MAK5